MRIGVNAIAKKNKKKSRKKRGKDWLKEKDIQYKFRFDVP